MLSKFPVGVLIDTKLWSRRAYSIITNVVISLLTLSISFKIFNTPETITLAIFLIVSIHVFLDQSLASYTIEQSRGVPFGVEDIQSFKMFWFGISAVSGSVLGTLFMHYEQPRMCFGLMGIAFFISAIQCYFLPEAMEKNERASVQDSETKLFYKNQQIDQFTTDGKIKKPGFCRILCFKMKLIKKGFSEKVLLKYVAFLFI